MIEQQRGVTCCITSGMSLHTGTAASGTITASRHPKRRRLTAGKPGKATARIRPRCCRSSPRHARVYPHPHPRQWTLRISGRAAVTHGHAASCGAPSRLSHRARRTGYGGQPEVERMRHSMTRGISMCRKASRQVARRTDFHRAGFSLPSRTSVSNRGLCGSVRRTGGTVEMCIRSGPMRGWLRPGTLFSCARTVSVEAWRH